MNSSKKNRTILHYIINFTFTRLPQKTPLNEGLPLRFAAGISTAIAAVCVAQPTEVYLCTVYCKVTCYFVYIDELLHIS